MNRLRSIELRCSRDLALRLGAIAPETTAHHRALMQGGNLLLRDVQTGWALFWPWQDQVTGAST